VKKSILFVIVFLPLPFLQAQVGSYVSRFGPSDVPLYSSIIITEEEGILFYDINPISTEFGQENEILQRVFLTGELEIENDILEIPSEGKFWFIPFDGTKVQAMVDGGHTADCVAHYTCSAGDCGWDAQGSCHCGTSNDSNPCHVIICDPYGGSFYRIRGPGVIVQGDSVVRKNPELPFYVSRVGDEATFEINMSFSGDSVFFIRVEVEFRDTIGERVYNLTKLEFEDSTSAIKNLIFEEEDTYWWIPFDKDYDVEQITITYYSYECCGNCGQYGECDWRPATPRCSECKCQNGIYSPCIAARHPVGVSLTEGSTGGGIIIQASVLIEY